MPISEETFFLDQKFEGTLQSQIQQMVAEGILSGRFRPGEKLPSSRRLAKHLGISRITITLAYTELVADDYIISRGRSGYFVSENAPQPPRFDTLRPREDAVDWQRAIGQRFSGATNLEKPRNWKDFTYNFIYGQADQSLFDHQNWRHCALRALGQRDFDALTSDYYEHDDPKLIEFIARHTLPRRGILARPEEILVTMGAQNALWLAAQVLLTQRRTAATEDPCYPGLREILHHTRCHVHSVPVDQNGLPPSALPTDVDVLFLTPSHHCPTSSTMPVSRRQELLARAERDEFLIVEDDYEFEMSFLEPPSPSLKSLDQSGRVIYVGSFSKSLFPGLRLGYLVGSAPFIREARALRSAVLRHPPGHIQRTAAYFLSHGHYDALIRRMGQAYHQRRNVMDQAIREHGLHIAGKGVFGGSSFWMKAPPGVNAALLTALLRKRGVLIENGQPFFSKNETSSGFYRLAYSSIPAEKIPEGIAHIADVMKSLQ
ncbi:MocR-like pyridoxine biosynthesis transcription factor PdxR [Cochlodiniinecator piscidefendens]|uniref:MocR-like pyridoxine biosynthesis transcription factor PdxR n=1 Tax=Cochlodiniinecator piscidefendens TaxID=2715756 RepID=UPI00140A22F2|nr:PLP-dependent aminotransferase family protein [Cochlodiniinecator piscidefendens]